MSDIELSERQRYWFDHIMAAEESGETLVAYAARQGLKTKDLYNQKSRFIKKGLMKSSVRAKDFIPVRMDECAQCCVHLPNGVRVEFGSSLSGQAIQEILIGASRLA